MKYYLLGIAYLTQKDHAKLKQLSQPCTKHLTTCLIPNTPSVTASYDAACAAMSLIWALLGYRDISHYHSLGGIRLRPDYPSPHIYPNGCNSQRGGNAEELQYRHPSPAANDTSPSSGHDLWLSVSMSCIEGSDTGRNLVHSTGNQNSLAKNGRVLPSTHAHSQ